MLVDCVIRHLMLLSDGNDSGNSNGGGDSTAANACYCLAATAEGHIFLLRWLIVPDKQKGGMGRLTTMARWVDSFYPIVLLIVWYFYVILR